MRKTLLLRKISLILPALFFAAVAAAAFVLIHSHNLLVVYTRPRREVWH